MFTAATRISAAIRTMTTVLISNMLPEKWGMVELTNPFQNLIVSSTTLLSQDGQKICHR